MPPMLITVPRALRERLGDEGSDALVALINEASDGIRTDVIALVEERFGRLLAEELAKVRQEIAALETRVAERFADHEAKMAALESRLEAKLARGFAELETKMAALRADVIKWMFLFWVGQVTVMTGLFLAFFRH
jgi:citrate lyase gamma subunit